MCSFYVNDLGIQEMPDFLTNIFNLHLVTLPWNHFEPQFLCINNMAKVEMKMNIYLNFT